jgi:Ca-activated chloride channel homolog
MLQIPLLLCAFVGAVSAGEEAPQTTTIRTDVSLVQLSVRVTDSSGRNVSGLKPDAFELYVDEVRQPITHFQPEDAPVTAGIVVDNSATMAPKRDEVIAAALAFARASNAQDQMFVVHFNNRPWFALPDAKPFTSQMADLQAAISEFHLGGTTALYDAILLAASRFRLAAFDRRVLLVITDGGDNSSNASFRDILDTALTDGVSIFAIGIFDEKDRDANPKLLIELARSTGGEAYFPAAVSDVTRVCQEIAGEIRRAYTLGFRGETDSKFHRIRVVASDPQRGKLTVFARAGYFGVKP